jgi:hypothetical protein
MGGLNEENILEFALVDTEVVQVESVVSGEFVQIVLH